MLRTSILMCLALALCGCGAAASYGGAATVEARNTTADWRSMGAPATPASTVTASGATTTRTSGGGGGGSGEMSAQRRVMEESLASAPASMDSGLGSIGGGDGLFGGEDDSVPQHGTVPIAQNVPATPPTPVGNTQRAAADMAARVADDAHRGPLLIYTATVYLSVFEVERTQRSVIEIARELGGFLVLQNDTQVTIRVPAPAFRDALARVEGVGDVLHRNVEAVDVSEEFRDLTIRMQNATAMRDRLQALLAQAHNAAEALAVEHELERVTLEIEQIKGRLQFLGERLAFSTITVMFQPHAEGVDQPGTFRLPFPWLDQLTLSNLLNLPYQN